MSEPARDSHDIIDTRDFGDAFVIHYGGELHQVDAYTLANSLLAICGAIQEINNEVNPGFAVEITVDALGGGSFRPHIRLSRKNLTALMKWGAEKLLVPILVAVLAARLSTKSEPTIEVKDNVIIFETDKGRYILPKEAYRPLSGLRSNHALDERVSQAFQILENDDAITDFGIAKRLEDKNLVVHVDRAQFPALAQPPPREEPDPSRQSIISQAKVQVIRAIFEMGARKWQFSWNGVRISAPILDDNFLHRLRRRDDDIGWGDILDVDLRINQVRDPSTGIWLNESYEIVLVRGHQPAPTQPSFPLP
ncbi:MAG TPA: hypothetical protein VNV39_04160 [Stellaceae bacterium]|jgi:hypothetical protein|nr:hypothetical protein [Stellaceae bacterium]